MRLPINFVCLIQQSIGVYLLFQIVGVIEILMVKNPKGRYAALRERDHCFLVRAMSSRSSVATVIGTKRR